MLQDVAKYSSFSCIYPFRVLHSGYMNKKLGVIIVIIVLLLLGGGAFVMSHKSVAPKETTSLPPANPIETKAEATGTLGSLKSLLTSTVPQTCTFASQKEATTNGTIYISGGKLRGDFTSTNEGQTINGHMLVETGYSYVWTDLVKRGMKVAITEGQTSENTNTQGMDLNQAVSYSCKPWIADASKFSLPTDVTFTTITLPPKAAAPSGTGTATSACSACDSLPTAAQSACKTQLNCQ
jgi:hypothetical protein